jgi:hypothetical protein
VTYKDQLENRKNARKLAQHQNQKEQPAQLARVGRAPVIAIDPAAGAVTALCARTLERDHGSRRPGIG